MVKASERKVLAHEVVSTNKMSISLACRTFMISETCYRYTPKLSDENEKIAALLLDLSQCQRNWGFGLCFLYLRNVKGYTWNHKRVYRIYRELELNLRRDSLEELIKTLTDGAGARKVAEWNKRMGEIRLEDMKLKREIDKMHEQVVIRLHRFKKLVRNSSVLSYGNL